MAGWKAQKDLPELIGFGPGLPENAVAGRENCAPKRHVDVSRRELC